MLNRIIGVITLKAPVYREIADDKTATGQAAMIFIIVTLISGFFTGLVQTTSAGTVQASLGGALVGAIIGLIVGLIGWVLSAFILAFVAGRLDGKTDTSEMLRVTGFVSVFNLVSILLVLNLVSSTFSCLTGIVVYVAAIALLVGYVIGVREAAEFTTAKAIITGIIATIVHLLIVFVIGGALVALVVGLLSLSH